MEEQEHIKEEQPNKFMIPAAIVVAGALVAGAIYFGDSASRPNSGQAINTNTEIKVPPVTSTDHYLGSRSAKVVIVEYSDTECPFCKVFHGTMKQVMSAYGSDVAWVYRHFPIPQLHARAVKEAEATECAAELGGNQVFWNYVDKIYETTNSNDSLDPAELPRIAASVGLNVTDFNNCLSSGRQAEKITKSMEEAVKAGARGTPFSVIFSEGEEPVVINGAEPFASIKTKIDALLK